MAWGPLQEECSLSSETPARPQGCGSSHRGRWAQIQDPGPAAGYVPFQTLLCWPCPACAWHHPWILLLLTPQSPVKAHNLLFIPQNPAYISLLLPLRGEWLPARVSCTAQCTHAPFSS